MDGYAAKKVTVSPITYQKGQAVSFPEDQFRTFEGLGLVQRTPVDGIDPAIFEPVEDDMDPATGDDIDRLSAARASEVAARTTPEALESDAALQVRIDALESDADTSDEDADSE